MTTTTIYLIDTDKGVEFHLVPPPVETNSFRLGMQIKTYIDTLAAQVNAPVKEIKHDAQ